MRPIVYVLNEYPVLSQTFVTNEVMTLRASGREVVVVAARRGDTDASGHVIPDIVMSSLRPLAVARSHLRAIHATRARYLSYLRWVGRSGLLGFPWVLAAPYVAERLRFDPTVHVHTHFASRGSVVAEGVRRLLGGTRSVTTHAADIYGNPRLDLQLENAILVTVTKFNAQYLARRGFEGAQVVHCGVVVKREPTPAQEIIRQGPVRMLSVGRLVPKKGHDVLLRALATLAREGLDFECEIIGDGPERHVLEEMVAELDLREMVCMRGSLPHDEVLRRIDRAQIFLLACRVSPDGDADGLPVVLLEAGARAVPIIASSVTGVGEFIDDETGWLVPSGNPEAIANAVREVIRAPEIARERARMAQKRVVDEFSLCAQAQGLASVIDRIPVA